MSESRASSVVGTQGHATCIARVAVRSVCTVSL